jgi:hypothetical protein
MNIDDLVRGSIDLHVHHAPGIMTYRMDALDTAKQASQMGIRAIVIKNQFYPTAPLTAMVGRLVPELKVGVMQKKGRCHYKKLSTVLFGLLRRVWVTD